MKAPDANDILRIYGPDVLRRSIDASVVYDPTKSQLGLKNGGDGGADFGPPDFGPPDFGPPELTKAPLFDPWAQYLTQQGYIVLEPNYRGSTGYGEKFRNLNVEDSGGSEADDVVAGAQYLVDQGLADTKRLGIGAKRLARNIHESTTSSGLDSVRFGRRQSDGHQRG